MIGREREWERERLPGKCEAPWLPGAVGKLFCKGEIQQALSMSFHCQGGELHNRSQREREGEIQREGGRGNYEGSEVRTTKHTAQKQTEIWRKTGSQIDME